MSKLLEDPKVAALVEKSVAAATKAETKRVLEIVKTQSNLDENVATSAQQKETRKVVTQVFKQLTAAIKG